MEKSSTRFGFGSDEANQKGVSAAASTATLVSSRISRAPPSAQVSCSSKKPPTRARKFFLGSIALRTTRSPVRPLRTTGTSTTDTGIGFAQICVLQLEQVRGYELSR
jgi:hypothetical protein